MDSSHRHALVTPTVPLTDGRVLLRLPKAEDSAAVYARGQDPDIAETAWLPLPFPCTWEDAAGIVDEFQQGWQSRFGLTLAITLPPPTVLCGVVHLSMHAAGAGEIGYGVAPRYRRQGLATHAVRLTAAWAFEHLALARLEIVVTAGGVHGLASRRVAEKAGFVYAGIRRSYIAATGLAYEDPLYSLPAPHHDT